ncbi:Protein kinase dsk1 [Cyberlindnera fabianii]|uniref:non-specific serine/threonine protein kinase n=1 Tax=Cyberlindnera fabianii TaxID=36022 RepID=A0A1V2L9H9_CYBFA|nr:Protein kinase dsk1 [Cyberlindnera fabianii]
MALDHRPHVSLARQPAYHPASFLYSSQAATTPRTTPSLYINTEHHPSVHRADSYQQHLHRQPFDDLMKRHVAIKIVKSKAHYTEAAKDEVNILTRARDKDTSHPGYKHLVEMYDWFYHEGPNGRHVCMVFEVLGQTTLGLIDECKKCHKKDSLQCGEVVSLLNLEKSYGGLPLTIVKKISKQLLLALDYIHRVCGLIHTDIKPENILIEIKDVEKFVDCLNSSDLRKRHNSSMSSSSSGASDRVGSRSRSTRTPRYSRTLSDTPIKCSKPLPSPLSASTRLDFRDYFSSSYTLSGPATPNSSSLANSRSFSNGSLADLGNACMVDRHFTNDIQTRQYRSPEILIESRWGASTDMWSVACVMFELITGDYLFDAKSGKNHGKDDDHIAQILELLQIDPSDRSLREWLSTGRATLEFFHSDLKTMRRIDKLKYWGLKDVLVQKYKMEQDLAKEVSEFLLPMLSYNPKERVDAGGWSNHHFLQDVKGTLSIDRECGTKGEDIPGWYKLCKRHSR